MTEPSTLDATRNAAFRAALTSRSLAVAVLVAATAGAAIGLILVRVEPSWPPPPR